MLNNEERIRALIGNLKNWSWDVIPVFKIEREDAIALLNYFESHRKDGKEV